MQGRQAKDSQTAGERFAPLTGVAVPVLGLAGLIVLEGPAGRPEVDVRPEAFVTYFGKHDSVVLGSFLLMLSVAFFLWFLGSLRAFLSDAEQGPGRLSSVAYGGGIVTAALMLTLPAVSVLGAMDVDHLSPDAAKTMFILGDASLYPAAMAAAVLTIATGLVVLRAKALPGWFGWLSLVLGLWLLVPPLGSSAGTPENPAGWTALAALDAVPFWTAAVAIMLMRRAGSAAQTSRAV